MKMFVLLRSDLKTPDGKKKRGYFIAQACHAVAKYSLEHVYTTPKYWDGYMIVLKVADGKELKKWEKRLKKDRNFVLGLHSFATFREPDLHNKKTALCCLAEEGFFDDLKLFK